MGDPAGRFMLCHTQQFRADRVQEAGVEADQILDSDLYLYSRMKGTFLGAKDTAYLVQAARELFSCSVQCVGDGELKLSFSA